MVDFFLWDCVYCKDLSQMVEKIYNKSNKAGETIWVKGCFIDPLDIPLHSAEAGGGTSLCETTIK